MIHVCRNIILYVHVHCIHYTCIVRTCTCTCIVPASALSHRGVQSSQRPAVILAWTWPPLHSEWTHAIMSIMLIHVHVYMYMYIVSYMYIVCDVIVFLLSS